LHGEIVQAHDGAVIVVPDLRRIGPLITAYFETLLLALLLAVAAAWAIARWAAAQAIAPLVQVTGELRRFAEGDFEPRPLATTDRSELGALTDAYNAAAAQVAAAFQERKHVEEFMRRFVADAGHELRTPLAVIRAYVEILRKGGLDDAALRERAFKTLAGEMNRVHELTDRLIALARLERPEPPKAERLDLTMVAQSAIGLATTVRAGDVSLVADGPVWAIADEAEIQEAIGNLVDNALKYARDEPIVVEVRARGSRPRLRTLLSRTATGRSFGFWLRASDRRARGGTGRRPRPPRARGTRRHGVRDRDSAGARVLEPPTARAFLARLACMDARATVETNSPRTG
jgi:two-component system OmpR family sensor kinase